MLKLKHYEKSIEIIERILKSDHKKKLSEETEMGWDFTVHKEEDKIWIYWQLERTAMQTAGPEVKNVSVRLHKKCIFKNIACKAQIWFLVGLSTLS